MFLKDKYSKKASVIDFAGRMSTARSNDSQNLDPNYRDWFNKQEFPDEENIQNQIESDSKMAREFFNGIVAEFSYDLREVKVIKNKSPKNFNRKKTLKPLKTNAIFSIHAKKQEILIKKICPGKSESSSSLKSKPFLINSEKDNSYLKKIVQNYGKSELRIEVCRKINFENESELENKERELPDGIKTAQISIKEQKKPICFFINNKNESEKNSESEDEKIVDKPLELDVSYSEYNFSENNQGEKVSQFNELKQRRIEDLKIHELQNNKKKDGSKSPLAKSLHFFPDQKGDFKFETQKNYRSLVFFEQEKTSVKNFNIAKKNEVLVNYQIKETKSSGLEIINNTLEKLKRQKMEEERVFQENFEMGNEVK